MTEEIKRNLSKCKYIYRIYKENDSFHIEKYPIVYINSEVVYFKTGRKNYIESMSFSNLWTNVKENFEKAIVYINNTVTCYDYYPTNVYFIETDKLKEFDLSLIKQRLKDESKESKIKKQEREVEKYKKSYELELRKLEDMKKEFEIEFGTEGELDG